jgi:biotin carboxylase
MEQMGEKIGARRGAIKPKSPLCLERVSFENDGEAKAVARIGLPIVLKAAAGVAAKACGWFRGMTSYRQLSEKLNLKPEQLLVNPKCILRSISSARVTLNFRYSPIIMATSYTWESANAQSNGDIRSWSRNALPP